MSVFLPHCHRESKSHYGAHFFRQKKISLCYWSTTRLSSPLTRPETEERATVHWEKLTKLVYPWWGLCKQPYVNSWYTSLSSQEWIQSNMLLSIHSPPRATEYYHMDVWADWTLWMDADMFYWHQHQLLHPRHFSFSLPGCLSASILWPNQRFTRGI